MLLHLFMVRSTIHFFLIGGALLVLELVWGVVMPTERPLLEVTVSPAATEAEAAARVDEEILVAEALRHGWLYNDPVIRRQLVRNMRFVAGENDAEMPPPDEEEALLLRAIDLGMHRTDPVVRQRLVYRVYTMAEVGALWDEATEEELREHLEAHPERFGQPARYRLSQVFLSRQRRAEELESDAGALGTKLRAERPPPEEAHRLGDPLPPSCARPSFTESGLDRTFGPGFTEQVHLSKLGRWEGPLRSTYGLHFVWIHEARPVTLPDLGEVRERVDASLRHDRRHRYRATYLRRLREWYRVIVVRGEDAE